MNVVTFQTRTPTNGKTAPVAPSNLVRHQHRERDFGVGYGKSSGYVSTRRYASSPFQPLFRCA